MKKYLLIAAAMLIVQTLSAKKIKFAVNMSNEIVNTTGIHVFGDFQEAAGYPFNWDPGSTEMVQELTDTNVYSVVIDVPAFHIYEYRYINGDQSYEVEFVPEESRVNGAFDDNRWMYVDSTDDDTAFVGVVPYSANAPVGLNLVVFRVNMTMETVSNDSVHVAGTWQGWDPSKCVMVNFGDTVYKFHRYQAYLPNGTYRFKYANGKTINDFEYVSGSCAVNDGREVVVTSDMLLEPYNFGSCLVSVSENNFASGISLYPNPSASNSKIEFNDSERNHTVKVADISGRTVRSYYSTENSLQLENLEMGIYTLYIKNSSEQEATLKLVIQ